MIDKEIAAALRISVRTVEFHIASARRALGARNRTHLAAIVASLGLVHILPVE